MADELTCNPDTWVDEHGDFLFRFALVRVRNAEAAEELVQEAFLGALKSLKNFRGEASERGWLVGILKNKIMDHFRRSGRERTLAESEVEDDAFDARGHWINMPQAWKGDPAKTLDDKEFWKTFMDCLSGLPERLSRVFFLKEMDENSSDEICKVLDLTPTNLWVMLHRARLRLRACLDANWFNVKGKA